MLETFDCHESFTIGGSLEGEVNQSQPSVTGLSMPTTMLQIYYFEEK
jgi:hypothetical protein